MSIESLCSHNTITVTPQTHTAGASWGTTLTDGTPTTKTCLVQELDGNEVAKYEARGLQVTHTLLFSSDPSIDLGDKITWGSDTLEVTGAYKEGRPGEDLLWIVHANKLDIRDR